MSNKDGIPSNALRTAGGCPQWTSPAMDTALRLYVGLSRRARSPARVGIRLATQLGRTTSYSVPGYAPVEMLWWLPLVSSSTFSPIDVFLSRQYFLGSNLPGQRIGWTEERKQRGATDNAVREHGVFASKETLIYSSPRRRPGSRSLIPLDSGLRRNDGIGINQGFPKGLELAYGWPTAQFAFDRHAGLSLTSHSHPHPLANLPVTAATSLASLAPVHLVPRHQGQTTTSYDPGATGSMPDPTRAYPSREAPQGHGLNGRASASASPVDALYDHAMQQLHMVLPGTAPGLEFPREDSRRSETALDNGHSHTKPSMASGRANPLPINALSREEVVHIADRVANVLKQRERFERERQGKR